MSSDTPMKSNNPKLSAINIIGFSRMWIERIQRWSAPHTLETYTKDEILQSAVHRAFTALGESIKDIPAPILALEPNGQWAPAKAFRDVVAHDYEEGLEHNIVWNTIQNDLPELDAALARLEAKLTSNT